MAYKTLMLQLYRPGAAKRRALDTAMLRYSRALQFLLDVFREKLEALSAEDGPVLRRTLLGMVDCETSRRLNDFDVQPFKDSLKLDFAFAASAYLAQKRNDPGAGYPLAFADGARCRAGLAAGVADLDAGRIGRRTFERSCSKLIARADRLHSLYFGRCDVDRDYCLLYDEFRDRFYAKMYLMNRSESVQSADGPGGLSLRYVAPDLPPLIRRPGKKRFLIFPLAFGKTQYDVLKAALKAPELLRSARLTKRDGRYYLMVNIECSPGYSAEVSATMGVARGVSGGLNYTVCGADGSVLQSGRLTAPPGAGMLFSLARRTAETAAGNRSRVVLEANGGRNDHLPGTDGGETLCLSPGQYAEVVRALRYKLPEKGLPPPAEVSANGLFVTCPRCGLRTRRNLVNSELFVCVGCGYASEVEWIGSENLAGRLRRYRSDKVPFTVAEVDGRILCANRLLGFSCELPPGVQDCAPMFRELECFLTATEGTFANDPKKYAVWKKLRQAPDLLEAVRLIDRRHP